MLQHFYTYIYIYACMHIEMIVFLLQNVIQHHAEWMNITREQPLTMALCYIGASCFPGSWDTCSESCRSNPRVTCDLWLVTSPSSWWGIKLLEVDMDRLSLSVGKHHDSFSDPFIYFIFGGMNVHLQVPVMSFLLITKWPGFNVCSCKK